MWLFRGPGHRVNITVMVLSPPGDHLCLSNENTMNLEEASAGKKKNKKH